MGEGVRLDQRQAETAGWETWGVRLMSKELVEAVSDSRLPQPLKTVLTIHAWYGRNEGSGIFPSVTTVARRTSYSKRNVHSIIQKAVKMGILVPMGRRGTSRGYVTEYRMDISRLPGGTVAEGESVYPSAVFEPESLHRSADSSLHNTVGVRTPVPESTRRCCSSQETQRSKT
jgi:hypothetical protein